MKTIELKTTSGGNCIIFVDKISAIKDNPNHRIIYVHSEKFLVGETIDEIMKLINN
jgi:hypothetical protein